MVSTRSKTNPKKIDDPKPSSINSAPKDDEKTKKTQNEEELPKESDRKKAKKSKDSVHLPPFKTMVCDAVAFLHDPKGSTYQSIVGYLRSHYATNFEGRQETLLRKALKTAVEEELLIQPNKLRWQVHPSKVKKVEAPKVVNKKETENQSFCGFPREISVEIFSYLSLVDLLRLGEVSKGINELTKSKKLFYHLDFSVVPSIPESVIRTLVENACGQLQSLTFPNGTEALLTEIVSKSPELKKLNVDTCSISPGWYKTLSNHCPKLTSLNYLISSKVNIYDDEISEINALFPQLQQLTVNCKSRSQSPFMATWSLTRNLAQPGDPFMITWNTNLKSLTLVQEDHEQQRDIILPTNLRVLRLLSHYGNRYLHKQFQVVNWKEAIRDLVELDLTGMALKSQETLDEILNMNPDLKSFHFHFSTEHPQFQLKLRHPQLQRLLLKKCISNLDVQGENLRYLHMGYSTPKQVLVNAPNLIVLSLPGTSLTSSDFLRLLEKIPLVQHIDISHTSYMGFSPLDVPKLTEVMTKLNRLEELICGASNCNINLIELFIRHCNNLRTVDMSRCTLKTLAVVSNSIKEITLNQCEELKQLSIASDSLESIEARLCNFVLAPIAIHKVPACEAIDLADSTIFQETLMQLLALTPNLVTLIVSNNRNLLKIEGQMSKLTSLDASNCSTLTNLSNFQCPALEYLNVTECTSLDMNCLQNYPKLQFLLARNAQESVEALATPKQLLELDITKANMDEASTIELLSSTGKTLVALSVGDCNDYSITNAIVYKIGAACPKLKRLAFENCSVITGVALRDMVNTSPTLESLTVKSCSKVSLTYIEQIMELHPDLVVHRETATSGRQPRWMRYGYFQRSKSSEAFALKQYFGSE